MGDLLHTKTGEVREDADIPQGSTINEVFVVDPDGGESTLIERMVFHPGDGPGDHQVLDHWRHKDHDDLLADSHDRLVEEPAAASLPEPPEGGWPDWTETESHLLEGAPEAHSDL